MRGTKITKMTHRVFMPPDSSWSRNRSPKIVMRIQNQITNMKNSNMNSRMSPSPNASRFMSASLFPERIVRKARATAR